MTTVISVENLSKTYRLGQIGTGTFAHDLAVWWARVRGKPNPLAKIGAPDYAGYGKRSAVRSQPSDEEIWALKDVSFTVQQGEVLGIIGRNGAGKSTLLKILSRVTAPTSGKIKIKGRVASLLEVGTGFHPELTGRENVYLNGAILGMTRAEVTRKFDEIVDFAGVEKFIDTPVKRYSSGMYVRLAFAVAAHLDPEILVVDEVLAVGDAEFQKKCLGKMGEVAQGGRTVLFVSHNLAMIRQLCRQAILLEKGCLAEYSRSEDVVSLYVDRSLKSSRDFDDLRASIQQYPPDRVFKLIDIGILQSGINTTVLGNGEPIEILFEYQVYEATLGLRVFFDLLGQNDELIFRSFHDAESPNIPVVQPGRYIARALVPAGWLAPRSYFIRFHATIHNSRMLIPNDGIRVLISVENNGSHNKAYSGDPIRGLLAPSIDWKVRQVEQAF